jgi:hypothetical protein
MPLTNVTFNLNPDHFANKKRLGKMQGIVYRNGGRIVSDSNILYDNSYFSNLKAKRFVLLDCETIKTNEVMLKYGDLFKMVGNICFGEQDLIDLIEERKKIDFIENLSP